jgi:hypothetical protein
LTNTSVCCIISMNEHSFIGRLGICLRSVPAPAAP